MTNGIFGYYSPFVANVVLLSGFPFLIRRGTCLSPLVHTEEASLIPPDLFDQTTDSFIQRV
jgi:hypothetical protein